MKVTTIPAICNKELQETVWYHVENYDMQWCKFVLTFFSYKEMVLMAVSFKVLDLDHI